MQGLARLVIAAFAALFGLGYMGVGASPGDRSDAYSKRDEGQTEMVLVADDDDDDTGDSNSNSASATSRSNDNTGSRVTAVSRDRDRSVGDQSRDWTHDGPGRNNRDWSGNSTNDRSRNDTR